MTVPLRSSRTPRSNKMGKKDIIKVECPIEDLDLDILGFIDHNITVNIIKDEKIVEKKDLTSSEAGCQRDQMQESRAASLPSSRALTRYLFLPMRRTKFTAANTAKRNTEVTEISNF